MKLTPEQILQFQTQVWSYYVQHRRDMPWRTHRSLYYVIVSELMLQQTQVVRVIPKFEQFVERFPDMKSLAAASLADVLVQWQGLGYNRRAKYLHATAQVLGGHGAESLTYDDLCACPGIGANTAGAIMAYAYNQPIVFIETNIRTVFIHEFFADQANVTDPQIRDCVEQTLERERTREWYYALMDYGAHLKKQNAHLSQSKHYKKQPPLHGSKREMRGAIIRVLSQGPRAESLLRAAFADVRFDDACRALCKEGLIERFGTQLRLTETKQPS